MNGTSSHGAASCKSRSAKSRTARKEIMEERPFVDRKQTIARYISRACWGTSFQKVLRNLMKYSTYKSTTHSSPHTDIDRVPYISSLNTPPSGEANPSTG